MILSKETPFNSPESSLLTEIEISLHEKDRPVVLRRSLASIRYCVIDENPSHNLARHMDVVFNEVCLRPDVQNQHVAVLGV